MSINDDSFSDEQENEYNEEIYQRLVAARENGEPLRVGETVDSSSDKVEVGPAKAIIAAVTGALIGGLTALGSALTDNVVTPQEWTVIALGVLAGAGFTGVSAWAVPTTVTRLK